MKSRSRLDLSAISALMEGQRAPEIVELVRQNVGACADVEDRNVVNALVTNLVRRFVKLERQADGLLKNTLPAEVANEIRHQRHYPPREAECSILFTDFVAFTRMAVEKDSAELVRLLDQLFSRFDEVIALHHGTKIKTIGDAYMAVFGAPSPLADHAVQAVRTGLALQLLLTEFNRESEQTFLMRVGIHCGAVTAAVVGRERMQYDVFGDAVNVASRIESSGEPGRVNVTDAIHRHTCKHFRFEPRGSIALKNRGEMPAYFVIEEVA